MTHVDWNKLDKLCQIRPDKLRQIYLITLQPLQSATGLKNPFSLAFLFLLSALRKEKLVANPTDFLFIITGITGVVFNGHLRR